MPNSYLVVCLIHVVDKDTQKEIHSENVNVVFRGSESRYLRGEDYTSYYRSETILYWVKVASFYKIDTANLLIAPEMKQLHEKIGVAGRWSLDAMVLETKEFQDSAEMDVYIANQPAETKGCLWNGEFS